MTAHEYKTLIDIQYAMTLAGWHPSVAGRLITRAADRVFASESGLGIQQTRRLQRELYPAIPPRPPVPVGGTCRHIQEIPGQEERLYKEINDLQQQGWNVMEVAGGGGYPKLKTFYACPPGVMPAEAQSQVLQSEPWGGALSSILKIGNVVSGIMGLSSLVDNL